MSGMTFGRTLQGTADAASWQQVEQQLELADDFAAVDQIAARLIAAGLRGVDSLAVQMARGRDGGGTVELTQVTADERAWLNEHMPVTAHQARGGWWLPEQVTVGAGICNLASLTRRDGRFGVAAAVDMKVKLDARSADAMFAAVVLQPAIEVILAPLLQRSGAAGKQAAARHKAWAAVDELYNDLGLDGGEPLTVLRPGPQWRQLDRAAQDAARVALLDTLAAQMSVSCLLRVRSRQLRVLLDAAYAKTKPGTPMPLARTVLTKARQPLLAAWFSSDWLRFVQWLGEQPNPGEQLSTTLPQTDLLVAKPGQASVIASETGLSESDVEAILLSFAGTATSTQRSAAVDAAADSAFSSATPIPDRVEVMMAFWSEFDARHAAQRSGTASLWGLVDEGFFNIGDTEGPARQHRQLLDPALNARIDELWQGTCLKRYPERIVSEPHPHKQMADAFGSALAFWHGVALTCWFICEGPSSRTDLAGLAHYHRRDLDALAQAGTPISQALFSDLTAAERRLGPVEEIHDNLGTRDVGHGITLEFSTTLGTRRAGFELLRDIVTHHRRQWASAQLEQYLDQRWRIDLLAVGREFHRRLAGRGKPPTHKQFAEFAADTANRWFNGDLSGLYVALGQRPPAQSRRVDLLPGDAYDLCWQTYRNLGGTPYDYDRVSHPENYGRNWELGRLAATVPKYLQLWEALDRPPTEQEFETKNFRWPWPGEVAEGWPLFRQAVEDALQAALAHYEQQSNASARPQVGRPAPAADPVAATRPPAPQQPASPATSPPRSEPKGLRKLFRRG